MPGFICEERLAAPSGDGKALERMLARTLKHAGFAQVEVVGGSNDKGVDVVGLTEGKRWIFQVKGRNREYSGKGAEEVRNAMTPYKADVAVLVTNTTFSESIYKYRSEQKDNGFDLFLWDGATLLEYFNTLPDYSSEYKAPRDYQLEAIEAVERKRGQGNRSALVVMATGLGKSLVANQLIAEESHRNPDQEVLVLAHTNDLVRQLETSSWSQLPKEVSTHLWTDGEKPAYAGGVVFATWQSVLPALERGEDLRSRYSLVIVDEAHHAPARRFRRLLEDLECNFRVGLTATPWRGDDLSVTEMFGEPAFTCDIVEGMQRGFLAEVDYRMLTDGIDWDAVSRSTEQGLTVKDLNRHLLVPERDLGMVKKVCDEMRCLENPKALAFCRSIDHANHLRGLFNNEGIRAAVIHSKIAREHKFKNLSDFNQGQIDLLISVEMLNEGVDLPDVNLVAFMRVTHSRRIFVQQLGRGLRISPNKDKVVVLDFVADIRRVAAGIDFNRRARSEASKIETVRYRDGEIVQFDNDEPLRFFDEYLSDIASVEDIDDDSQLRFPGDSF